VFYLQDIRKCNEHELDQRSFIAVGNLALCLLIAGVFFCTAVWGNRWFNAICLATAAAYLTCVWHWSPLERVRRRKHNADRTSHLRKSA